MRLAMTALAVVLLAQAAPALAQPAGIGRGHRDDGERPSRAEMQHDRPQADGPRRGGGGHDWDGRRRFGGGDQPARPAPTAPAAVNPPPAPAAQAPPRAEGRRWEGERRARSNGERRDFNGQGGDRRDWDGRHSGARRDLDQRDEARSGQSPQYRDRRFQDRQDRDRQFQDRQFQDRRDRDRRDWDRRDWDRRDGDRRDDRRDWDRRWGDHSDWRRWESGRYPSAYRSSHRYHRSWRPPSGYYVRLWSFGEFLPHGWWGPDWWLDDPWSYDLPLPPPGYEWVRVGDDALLIDEYTGRIVQVVRDVFW